MTPFSISLADDIICMDCCVVVAFSLHFKYAEREHTINSSFLNIVLFAAWILPPIFQFALELASRDGKKVKYNENKYLSIHLLHVAPQIFMIFFYFF